jgi:glycosyltransferase involved in cell wall biosynthesis
MRPRTRIAQLVYEPLYGGQSTHVLALAEGLDLARYDVEVIYPAHNAVLGERLAASGVRCAPMRLRRLNNLGATLQLARRWRDVGVELVHVHGQQAGIFGRVAARWAGVPSVVYTPHTIDLRRRYFQRPYWWLERMMAAWTTAIISVNEADRRRLIDAGIGTPGKVFTVYCGIDPARFRPNPARRAAFRQTLGVPPDVPLVVQVGRLHPQKGPAFFVQAGALVNASARFALVGEGPQREELLSQIQRAGLDGRVFLAGWRPDVAAVLGAADVFVLASLWEGLPLTILEAMSVGCPVIATDVNGCREAVTDGVSGLLVAPGDPAALAAAIDRLLADPALRVRLSVEARRTIEERFSAQASVAAIQAIYERALADRSR